MFERRAILQVLTAIAPTLGWWTGRVADLESLNYYWAVNFSTQRPAWPPLTLEEAQQLALGIAATAGAAAENVRFLVCIESDDHQWARTDSSHPGTVSRFTDRPNFPRYMHA
jgi:hypothetical protein